MNLNSLELTSELDGRLLRISGDLNYATIEEAQAGITPFLQDRHDPIVLDLRQVEMFTSIAIEMLLEASKDRDASELILLVNEQIENVLRIAGVTSLFSLASTESEALRDAKLDR